MAGRTSVVPEDQEKCADLKHRNGLAAVLLSLSSGDNPESRAKQVRSFTPKQMALRQCQCLSDRGCQMGHSPGHSPWPRVSHAALRHHQASVPPHDAPGRDGEMPHSYSSCHGQAYQEQLPAKGTTAHSFLTAKQPLL